MAWPAGAGLAAVSHRLQSARPRVLRMRLIPDPPWPCAQGADPDYTGPTSWEAAVGVDLSPRTSFGSPFTSPDGSPGSSPWADAASLGAGAGAGAGVRNVSAGNSTQPACKDSLLCICDGVGLGGRVRCHYSLLLRTTHAMLFD